jgi:hypothetical protein
MVDVRGIVDFCQTQSLHTDTPVVVLVEPPTVCTPVTNLVLLVKDDVPIIAFLTSPGGLPDDSPPVNVGQMLDFLGRQPAYLYLGCQAKREDMGAICAVVAAFVSFVSSGENALVMSPFRNEDVVRASVLCKEIADRNRGRPLAEIRQHLLLAIAHGPPFAWRAKQLLSLSDEDLAKWLQATCDRYESGQVSLDAYFQGVSKGLEAEEFPNN